MASTTINCADCGAEHVAQRSDAKYCPSDRLLRVLLYAGTQRSRPKKCRGCAAPFLPIHAKDLSHCGACEAVRRMDEGPLIMCAFCEDCDTFPALPGSTVPCCIVCAKDPDVRPQIIRALKKGRRQRRAKEA